ncbi:hypothetical protein GRX01_08455 [Halobaculum sp. WSA2]|uniref:RNA ligase domain-containing protein n=1 Tax=Halobaculum saliterrae TaxID=2073113 RepID=A0A6B0SR01_9EURY|nr:hypothetical protein [Halobaculum saliterrae]MXR41368.1 hypothetical protein [Halobaculum saliterrae]
MPPSSSTPSLPSLEAVSEEFLEGGHVRIEELPDGTVVGIELGSDGRLRLAFPDASIDGRPDAAWTPADSVPPRYDFAARYLGRRFDRNALRAAVADPTAVTVWGVAVHRRRRGYDWGIAPPVVGLDIDHPEATLLPHELDRAFDELGLPSPPTIDTEVHVRGLSADGVETPETRWGDGTALGVLYRKKGGGLATTRAPRYRDPPPVPEPLTDSAEEYAAAVASPEAIASEARALESDGRSPTVSALADRVTDRTLRDQHPRITNGETTLAVDALRSAVARRVAEHVGSSSN